ncbi:MAG: cob(I)yrinic acid a,c-diamide adenosyltransferase [Bacteroidetes bacterium]|nr:MAG: cob(I)yrinic acid a,c-diamide adenosyltransferase [Bacteroidota bacterium]
MSNWKIYTKTGDKGNTSLIGGTRVPKYDDRIEAYGTVDELNAWIGLIRDQEIDNHSKTILLEIQDRLFTIESLLATDTESKTVKLPSLSKKDVLVLENEIDKMNQQLPELTSFILPGGHPIVSYCHLGRTVCRRSERLVIKLAEKYDIDPLIVTYLNRLSDYLFVLSRYFSKKFGGIESVWNARL